MEAKSDELNASQKEALLEKFKLDQVRLPAQSSTCLSF